MRVETTRRVLEAGVVAAGILVFRAASSRLQAREYNKMLSTGGFTGTQKAAVTDDLPRRVAKRVVV